MSTLTKEWLQQTIAELEEERDALPGAVNEDAANALAAMKLALASLEAEPVSFDDLRDAVAEVSGGPAMEWSEIYKGHQAVPFINFNSQARIVDKFRAAMLQGAENVESPTTMQTAPALDSSQIIAESPSVNSPVIPDGWVIVPVEPTEHMIVEGFESEPDEFFSDAEMWEAYEAMSGCQQAAHRAKLCWAAMIAASPKPEVK